MGSRRYSTALPTMRATHHFIFVKLNEQRQIVCEGSPCVVCRLLSKMARPFVFSSFVLGFACGAKLSRRHDSPSSIICRVFSPAPGDRPLPSPPQPIMATTTTTQSMSGRQPAGVGAGPCVRGPGVLEEGELGTRRRRRREKRRRRGRGRERSSTAAARQRQQQ